MHLIFFKFLICPFLIESIHLDPRFSKFNKFQVNEATNALNNTKKYITKFINEHNLDSVNTSSNAWSNKSKIEMTIEIIL